MRSLVIFLCFFGSSVPAIGASVPAARYVALAREALQNELQSREGRIELHARGAYRDVDMPALDDVELHVRVTDAEPAASAVVWIDVLSRGRVERRIPVSFHVSCYRRVLTARTALEARSRLDPAMLSLEEADAARVRGQALDDLTQIAGKRLKRDISANAPIGTGDIEDLPPVQAGDAIRVIAVVGSVRVQRVAIAQSDGFPGQRIRARVPGDGTALRVEIMSAGNAKVVGDG